MLVKTEDDVLSGLAFTPLIAVVFDMRVHIQLCASVYAYKYEKKRTMTGYHAVQVLDLSVDRIPVWLILPVVCRITGGLRGSFPKEIGCTTQFVNSERGTAHFTNH